MKDDKLALLTGEVPRSDGRREELAEEPRRVGNRHPMAGGAPWRTTSRVGFEYRLKVAIV